MNFCVSYRTPLFLLMVPLIRTKVMYQLYSNNILYSFVCLYTFPDKIQPIRMQKIRCIFDGSASPFPSCALIVLSGKMFTRLKVVKTSKITSSQKRLVFYFFHHLNTVFSLVDILNLMEINIVLFLVSIFSSVRPKRRLKILWSKRIDNS